MIVKLGSETEDITPIDEKFDYSLEYWFLKIITGSVKESRPDQGRRKGNLILDVMVVMSNRRELSEFEKR